MELILMFGCLPLGNLEEYAFILGLFFSALGMFFCLLAVNFWHMLEQGVSGGLLQNSNLVLDHLVSQNQKILGVPKKPLLWVSKSIFYFGVGYEESETTIFCAPLWAKVVVLTRGGRAFLSLWSREATKNTWIVFLALAPSRGMFLLLLLVTRLGEPG